MSELMMKGAKRPAKVMFEYRVSDAWRDQWTIEHGEDPSVTFLVTFNLKDDLDRSQRERALRLAPLASRVVKQKNPFLRHPVLPEPSDDPAVVLEAWERHLGQIDLDRLDEFADLDADVAREDFVREMGEWTETHGSPRLKRAIERGYRATGIYVEERARQELPDFLFDGDRLAVFREALNPSAAALDLETATIARLSDHARAASSVRIVWLTDGPDDWPLEIFPGEAVHVEFLGHARLFKPLLDPELELDGVEADR